MPGRGNIHRRLGFRMLAAALLIAAALGTGVHFYLIEQVDEDLVALAKTEARSLIGRILPFMPAQTDTDRAAVAGALQGFVASRPESRDGHFVFAEVYGRDRKTIAEFIDEDKKFLESEMDKSAHKFPKKDVWYRKITIRDRLYLQAVVRLDAPVGPPVGFFEGVYQVAPETLASIDHATKTSTVLVVLAVILATGVLYPVVLGLNRTVMDRSRDLLEANLNTLEALGDAIAKRDSDTNVHNYRVTIYAIRLAEAVDLPDETIRALVKGAFLHDIGKIAISDAILLKPGKLTPDEFEIMKTHVSHGMDIVSRSPWLADAAEVVRYHHEKFDGKGYLGGLKAEEIPVTARVFAIVDVFDALTSRRPYKEPLPLEKTLEILREGRGSHFDPVLLDVFVALAPGFHAAYAGREDKSIEADLHTLIRRYFDPLV